LRLGSCDMLDSRQKFTSQLAMGHQNKANHAHRQSTFINSAMPL
jgi:hypothetical protein